MKIFVNAIFVAIVVVFLSFVCVKQVLVAGVVTNQGHEMRMKNQADIGQVAETENGGAVGNSPFKFFQDIIHEISGFLGSWEYWYRNPYGVYR